MTNAQRTVTTMLAVVAVMLGLNLIVRGSPPAVAQGPNASGPVQATVVAGAVSFPTLARGGTSTVDSEVALVLRFWSDGTVDGTRVHSDRRDDACSGGPPTVCDGPTMLIPSSCPADVNRDRDVGVGDLLDVFAMWGQCE